MWGRRKRRRTRLSRQLALGLLQDAMGQVEEQHESGEGAGSGQAPAPPPAEQPPLVPRQPGSSSSPDDAHTTQT
jgi:hypothetical protein